MIVGVPVWLRRLAGCSKRLQGAGVHGFGRRGWPSWDSIHPRPQPLSIAMALCYPMAMGLNKGHQVTENVRKSRHSCSHGQLTKHTKFVRDVIREVCGFVPYEWRAMDPLEICQDKWDLKFIKEKVGHTSAPRGSGRA